MNYYTLIGVTAISWVISGSPAHGQQSVVSLAADPIEQQAGPLSQSDVSPTNAAETRLALADLEQMALANNPSVASASALVEASRGNWIQVGLPPNPTIGYDGQQLGSGGRAEQHGVIFNQEIVRGGKLQLNRAIAGQELARAQRELEAQRQRVLTDIRIAFYQALMTQRQIDLTSNLVRISTQGVTAVNAIFEVQEASRADVLQAQLEVENARILAENALNRHASVWRRLSAVSGNPNLPPQPLMGNAFAEPRDIDFEEALRDIQTMSPEIAAAVVDVGRARATLERARAEPISNVNIEGLFNIVDNGIGGRPDAGLAISVPLPIFNYNQGAILQAQHQIIAAEQALHQLELSLRSRLAPIFERYSNARSQVERYRQTILPAATESLDLTRQIYEAGETNFVGLLTVQRTFFQTNLNYLAALESLRIAEVEIEGLLLRDSLDSRPGN